MAPAESICFCGNNVTQYRQQYQQCFKYFSVSSNICVRPGRGWGPQEVAAVGLFRIIGCELRRWCMSVYRPGPPESKNVQIRRRWPSAAMLHHYSHTQHSHHPPVSYWGVTNHELNLWPSLQSTMQSPAQSPLAHLQPATDFWIGTNVVSAWAKSVTRDNDAIWSHKQNLTIAQQILSHILPLWEVSCQ